MLHVPVPQMYPGVLEASWCPADLVIVLNNLSHILGILPCLARFFGISSAAIPNSLTLNWRHNCHWLSILLSINLQPITTQNDDVLMGPSSPKSGSSPIKNNSRDHGIAHREDHLQHFSSCPHQGLWRQAAGRGIHIADLAVASLDVAV